MLKYTFYLYHPNKIFNRGKIILEQADGCPNGSAKRF